ncbi:hypothetical protein ACVMFA_002814 [Bradyrhizobium liaoningense]
MPVLMSVLMHGTSVPRVVKSTRESRSSRPPKRGGVVVPLSIQALDREQPVLPMMPGIPERRTHSYVRHGATTLFAALDVASGFVIGKCYKRHRAVES